MQNDISGAETGSPLGGAGSGAPDVPFEPLLHAVIADHKLIRCIGRGAYGEVWLARHTMGMYRAIKIVHRRYFRDRHPFERELSGIRKFEPISRSHRGFIDILHVGMDEHGEYFYYVMELGDDQKTGSTINPDTYSPKTLARELRLHGTLEYQQGLQLGLDLSRALSELHRNGLVHRDIKPSNILFVNGVPKLADIGLVSVPEEARSYVGTEGFIPPEGPGSAQADVYALGKVLYEAITGKDRLDYPELPPDWDARPSHEKLRELNEVVLHACNNAPGRYQTAEDLHADLVVLLAGKSVRRLKSLERQVSRLKRLGAVAAVIALITAIAVYVIVHEREMAMQVRQARVSSLIAHGNSAMEFGDVGGALPYFVEAIALEQPDTRREKQAQVRFASLAAQSPRIVQMWFATNLLHEVGISSDGKKVLVVESQGKAQIFDIASGEPITPRFGQATGLLRGSFDSDASRVATTSEDNTTCVWSAQDGKLIKPLDYGGSRPLSASFSPNGTRLITGCNDGEVWVWDTATWTCVQKLSGHSNAVLFATYSHHGTLIATSSRDNTVRIWDAATGAQIGRELRHSSWVDYVAFSPDDTVLVTACQDRKARIWDVATHERILPDILHDEIVSSVAFSPDGRLILTSCFDGTARLWLAADHQPFIQTPILRHSDKVKHASFDADGHRIVTGCIDGTVRVWDLAGAVLATELKVDRVSQDGTKFLRKANNSVQVGAVASGGTNSSELKLSGDVLDANLSADGGVAITLSGSTENQKLDLWDTRTRQPLGSLPWSNGLAGISLSLNSKRLLALGSNTASLFEVPGLRFLSSWECEDKTHRSLRLSPDGATAAFWGNSAVSLYDTVSGKSIGKALEHRFPITDVQFSQDSRRLVTCGADDSLGSCYAQIWSAATGEQIGAPLMHADGVLCSIFSRRGDFVVTGGEDGKGIVWQAASANDVIVKHRNKVPGVAISPDEGSFATASLDKTARVWSIDSGDPLTPALRHHSPVNAVIFLPDGDHLVTIDKEHRFWLWQLSPPHQPLEDLIRFSRLLSGAPVLPIPGPGPSVREPLPQIWQELRKRHPDHFTVSKDQVKTWYAFQADESEIEGNVQAASFYLQRLAELAPEDRLIHGKLALVKEKLAQANPPVTGSLRASQ